MEDERCDDLEEDEEAIDYPGDGAVLSPLDDDDFFLDEEDFDEDLDDDFDDEDDPDMGIGVR